MVWIRYPGLADGPARASDVCRVNVVPAVTGWYTRLTFRITVTRPLRSSLNPIGSTLNKLESESESESESVWGELLQRENSWFQSLECSRDHWATANTRYIRPSNDEVLIIWMRRIRSTAVDMVEVPLKTDAYNVPQKKWIDKTDPSRVFSHRVPHIHAVESSSDMTRHDKEEDRIKVDSRQDTEDSAPLLPHSPYVDPTQNKKPLYLRHMIQNVCVKACRKDFRLPIVPPCFFFWSHPYHLYANKYYAHRTEHINELPQHQPSSTNTPARQDITPIMDRILNSMPSPIQFTSLTLLVFIFFGMHNYRMCPSRPTRQGIHVVISRHDIAIQTYIALAWFCKMQECMCSSRCARHACIRAHFQEKLTTKTYILFPWFCTVQEAISRTPGFEGLGSMLGYLEVRVNKNRHKHILLVGYLEACCSSMREHNACMSTCIHVFHTHS